jgi:hypothetical protein
MKTAEPADFQAELQDEFHITEFMLQARADRLGKVGELFGPARIKRPTALKEILPGFRALNEVGQCPSNSKDAADSAKEKFLLLVHKVFTLGT